jgi:hypothetical protein
MSMPETPVQLQIAWKKKELNYLRKEERAARRTMRDSMLHSPAWDTASLKLEQLADRIQEVEEWLRTLPW